MKRINRLKNRVLSLVLSTVMVFQLTEPALAAGDPEPPEETLVLTVNEQAATPSNQLAFAYGEPLTFGLRGYEGSEPVSYQYATQTDAVKGNYSDISDGACELIPGATYVLKYGVSLTDEDYREDDNFAVTVNKGKLGIPGNLVWDGSMMRWDVTASTAYNTALRANSVGGYRINIYKDGNLVGTKFSETNRYTNIVNDIKQDEEYQNGTYTFTVQTVVSTAGADYYTDSDFPSTTSGEYIVPKITIQESAGGKYEINPEEPFLLVPGNLDHMTQFISVTPIENYTFLGWELPEGVTGLSLEDSKEAATSITAQSGYAGPDEITLVPIVKDSLAPSVILFAKDTEKEDALIATAQDMEDGLTAYAFSRAASQEQVPASDWIPLETPSNEVEEFTFAFDADTISGEYYFYAKDGAGNVTRSSGKVRVTHITLHDCFQDNSLKTVHRFLIDEDTLSFPVSTRPAWNFEGWYQEQEYTGSSVTEAWHAQEDYDVYAKWVPQGLQLNTLSDVTKTYDGVEVTLSAARQGDGNTGSVSYQWYSVTKNPGEEPTYTVLDGKTEDHLVVKNVADSGIYAVSAVLTDAQGNVIESLDQTASTQQVTVTIAPAPLTIKAVDKSIAYGDEAPEYTVAYFGFVTGEDESLVTKGTLTCAYEKGNPSGPYDIIPEDFTADNYAVDLKKGTLNVTQKEGSVTAMLADPTAVYVYEKGTAYCPDVIVKDGDRVLEESEYSLRYSGNDVASDETNKAKVYVDLTGNYTGTVEVPFHIEKAAHPGISISASGWTYGETPIVPVVSGDPEENDAKVVFYYAPISSEEYVTDCPVNAGNYKVYAKMEEGSNYLASEVSDTKMFAIAKREITITAATTTFHYDGYNHSDSSYKQVGTFAHGEDFAKVTVSGVVRDVTNVGVTNSIAYTLTTVTNEDNYIIHTVNGKLYVDALSLTIPSGVNWKQNNPGTVGWVAVSKRNLNVEYRLNLYAYDKENDTYIKVNDEPVVTSATSYNFKTMIQEFAEAAAEEGKAYSYAIDIQTLPAGGTAVGNFIASDVSDKQGALHTAQITIATQPEASHFSSASVRGEQTTLLLQGESVNLEASLMPGYIFSHTPWTVSSGFRLSAIVKEDDTCTGKVQIASNVNESLLGGIVTVHAEDEVPEILTFTGSNTSDYQTVDISFSAKDSSNLTGWMLTNSAVAPAADATGWNELSEQGAAVYEKSLSISQGGEYYLYVKDEGGNVVGSTSTVAVYKIEFDAGDAASENEGVHPYLLKTQHTTVTLPENHFHKEGYLFQNWHGNTGIYNNAGSYGANANDTLVAYWTGDYFDVDVEYYYMKADGSYEESPDEVKSFNVSIGTVLNVEDEDLQITKSGYRLHTSKMEGNKSVTVDKAGKILKIYYERLSYTVSKRFTKPGDTEETILTQTHRFGTDISEEFNEESKPVVPGYTFIGWDFGENGKKITLMPAQDVQVTGSFVPNETSYKLRFFTQDLKADTYTLQETYNQNFAAIHGDEVTLSEEDIPKIDGFSYAGMCTSYGASFPALGEEMPEVSPSVTEMIDESNEDGELYINVFYTRNSYDVTLKVWQGAVKFGSIQYTKKWTYLYEEELTPEIYAHFNEDNWEHDEEYVLADYVGWSTGLEAPTTMPAGNVEVTRQFVIKTLGTYKVEIYLEGEVENNYEKQEFTYYDVVGSQVSLGDNSTYTVDYTKFSNSIKYFQYYHRKEVTVEDIEAGTVTGADGPSTYSCRVTDTNNGAAQQVMRVFFERNVMTSTFIYYYDPGVGHNYEFARTTKQRKWGATGTHLYNYEPLAFFDTAEDGNWIEEVGDITYKQGVTIEGQRGDVYDFRNNNYLVSFAGYFALDDDGHWPSKNINSIAAIQKNDYAYAMGYGTNTVPTTNYVHVYYSKVDTENQFYVDVKYNARELEQGENKKVPATYTYEGTEYKIRFQNEAFFYNGVYVSDEFAEYPGLGYANANYAGENVPTATGRYIYTVNDENIREGYEKVSLTINGKTSDYFLNGEYIYIPVADNRLFAGNFASLNLVKDHPGYQSIVDFLNQYKADHADLPSAPNAYIHHTSYGGTIAYTNGELVVTFHRGSAAYLYYHLDNLVCSRDIHLYSVGQTIDHTTVGCECGTFNDLQGYEIAWYRDSAFQTPIDADFKMVEGGIHLYGQYEKQRIECTEYAYYELPDPVTKNGVTYRYITEADLDAFEGDDKMVRTEAEGVITYTYDGHRVLAANTQVATALSPISMAVTDFYLEGYLYDESNPNNLTRGYCEVSPITLHAYFVCNKQKFLTDYRKGDSEIEENDTLYGQQIVLPMPSRDGYEFDGWSWQKKVGDSFTAWTVGAPSTDAEDIRFSMPDFDVMAVAQWKTASYEQKILHYFQTTALRYRVEDVSSMRAAVGEDITVELGETGYSGKRYANGGVSFAKDGDIYYYAEATETAQDTYSVTDFLPIAIEETELVTEEEEMAADSFCLSVPHYEYDYTRYTYEKETYNLESGDTYHNVYGMKLEYFYALSENLVIDAVVKATDGGEAPHVILGTDTTYFGKDMTVTVSNVTGFDFVGWYKWDDCMEGDAVKEDLTGVTKLSGSRSYNFSASESVTLVAVVAPQPVDVPTLTIGGVKELIYGYPKSPENAVTTKVVFPENKAESTYIKSYQWYENDVPLSGENGNTDLVHEGLNKGVDLLKCEVVIARRDNGREITIVTDEWELKVLPSEMTVYASDYDDYYDANYHGITLEIDKPEDAGDYVIYYSDKELTADNYTDGTVEEPTYKNVKMEDGIVKSYDVYYYIHYINEKENYLDASGYQKVTIRPVVLTMEEGNASTHKVYDGKTKVSGSPIEEGTDLYELVHSEDLYYITGLMAEDQMKGYIISCEANYNSAHCAHANAVTLSHIKLIDDSGDIQKNYIFDDEYTITLTGYLNPLVLNLDWTGDSFQYDGAVKCPTAAYSEGTKIPEEDVDNLKLTVAGGQTRVGSYSASATLSTTNASTDLKDFGLQNGSHDYDIIERSLTIKPKTETLTYDGNEHALTEYEIVSGDLPEGHTITFTVDNAGTNAGTYETNLTNVRVWYGTTDISDYYNITKVPANLVIEKKTVTVSGITASDKPYDGTTDAEISLSAIVFPEMVEGDELGLDLEKITAAFDNADSGDRTVNLTIPANALIGDDKDNYVLDVENSQKDCEATIGGLVITVTARNVTETYGETAVFAVDYSGFAPGESESILLGDVTYTVGADAAQQQAYNNHLEVGTYVIVPDVSGLSTAKGNYTFKAENATLTIEKRKLGVQALSSANIAKDYDGTTSATVTDSDYEWIAVSGVSKSGQVFDDEINLTFSAEYDSKNVDATKVGMTGLSIDNENYDLVTEAFDIPGEIDKLPLTITAKNLKKTYGNTMASTESGFGYGVSYDGFIEGEDESVLEGTLVYDCSSYDPTVPAKRKKGEYPITVTGVTTQNYAITFVPGKLVIEPATITITTTADPSDVSKQFTARYGVDNLPTFNYAHSALQYTDVYEDVVSGTVTYSHTVKTQVVHMDEGDVTVISSVPKTYAITPVVTGLSSVDGNYIFKPVAGALRVDKYGLKVYGVKVGDKVYDGTCDVYATQFDLSTATFDGLLKIDWDYFQEHPEEAMILTEGTYRDANASDSKITIDLNLEPGTYLTERCFVIDESQDTAQSFITKRPLAVTAEDCTVKYGQPAPEYKVTYGKTTVGDNENPNSGFVTGQTAGAAHVTFTCAYNGSPAESEKYSPVTEEGYTITVSAFTGSDTALLSNYAPEYHTGTLKVLQNQLAIPSDRKWDRTTPGRFTWTGVSGIGDVAVEGYEVTLYRNDTAVAGSRRTIAASEALEVDYQELIHNTGEGTYTVKVKAIASTTDNEGKKNVIDSELGTSDKLYAAKVVFEFATDDITSSGKGDTINVSGEASYTMIAGETLVPITAGLANATGYTVKSVAVTKGGTAYNKLTVADPTDSARTGATYQSEVSLSKDLAAADATTVKVTLALQARAATLEGAIEVTNSPATYGYTSALRPKLTATATVTDADNVTEAGYTYTYRWTIRKGNTTLATYQTQDSSEATNVVYFPLDQSANKNQNYYTARCIITATRIDNGQSTSLEEVWTLTAPYVSNIVVKQAQFTANTALEGWEYGEARKVPVVENATTTVEKHPGLAADRITYTYVSKQVYDADETTNAWSGTQPKDAGEYYVRATVPESTNYETYTTAPTAFTIAQTQLSDPENLNMAATEENASYGTVTWDAVDVIRENVTGTAVGVKYTVVVEQKSGDEWVNIATYEGLTERTQNITSDIQEQGTYRYGVKAVSQDTRNCRDSGFTYSEEIPIGVSLTLKDNGVEQTVPDMRYARKYDGKTISLETTYSGEGTNPRYQWFKNGAIVENATEASLSLLHVADSGKYNCEVIVTINGQDTIVHSPIMNVTIRKRSVKLTSGSAEKSYDGTALTKASYEVSGDGFVRTEGVTLSYSGTQTGFGSSKNNFTYALKSNTTAGDYTITTEAGTLKVTKLEVVVTVTGNNDTVTYDGVKHTVTGYTWTSAKKDGTAWENQTNLYQSDADITFSGTDKAEATHVKTTDGGKYAMGLLPEQFSNTNTNFEVTFVVVDGWLKMNPIDGVNVAISGNHNTQMYDGASHSVEGFTFTATGDSSLYKKADITVTGDVKATRTDYGTTNMGLAASQFANNNADFTNVNFTIAADGYMTITKKTGVVVTITGHTDTKMYDGEEHSISGYEVSTNSDLYTTSDFQFTGTAEAVRTNAGTTEMGLTAGDFTNISDNFEAVTFEVTDGSMTITKRTGVIVTITGKKNTATYDGNAHSVNGYEVSINDSLYAEGNITFNGTALAVRTNVGTTNMGLAEAQFSNNNSNFATVTFQVTDGYQTIRPLSGVVVSIAGKKNVTTYDGNEHSVEGYEVTEISNTLYKATDIAFEGEAKASRTNAGTTGMGLTEAQFSNTNHNFTNVTFLVTDGYQTINPLTGVVVTVTGKTNTVTYDGTEHSVSGYEVSINNALYAEENITFSGNATVVGTNANTYPMGLVLTQFGNNNDNFKEVTFEVTDGWLQINPLENVVVTITGHHHTDTYNGAEHSISGYDFAANSTLYEEENVVFTGTAVAKRTNAGTTNMGLEESQFSNNNHNFKNVTFAVTDGYQTVNPLENVEVTIIGNKNTIVYDGEEHSVSGYSVSINNALYTEADYTFSGTATAARTVIGTTAMGLTSALFTNHNDNFKDVTFKVTDGSLTITKKGSIVVTITGHRDTNIYDGTAHVVNGYEVSVNNALYTASDFHFTGVDTAECTNVGTVYMGLTEEQFVNDNENFEVTFRVVDGYSTVTPYDGVVVTITGNQDTVVYDGSLHTVDGYVVSTDTELYTANDFTFAGTAQAGRTHKGTNYMNLESGQFSNISGNFTNVSFVVTDGLITINPLSGVKVQITGQQNTATYDATAHEVNGYTAVSNSNLYSISNMTFSGNAKAEQTDAGIAYMGLAATQFGNTNEDFEDVLFEVTDGYQKILPVEGVVVTITGHQDTKIYDGTEYGVSGFEVSSNNAMYTAEDFVFNGTASAVRTNAGITQMGLRAAQFANTNDNFKDVVFEVTDGYQEILPAEGIVVTITGHQQSNVYDGLAHSITGYEVSVNSELYPTSAIAFSAEAVATRTNVGTTAMGLHASQFSNTDDNFKDVTFMVTDGYQMITPLSGVVVTITGNRNSEVYDGTEHLTSGYTFQADSALYKEEDMSFTGSASASRKNAGTTYMKLTADRFANQNANFENVTFVVNDGYQTITPLSGVEVTITGNSRTATYDGLEHVSTGYQASYSSPLYKAKDYSFTKEAIAKRTDAGTTYMGLTAEDFENTSANFENVTFVVTDGYVQVDPCEDVVVTIVGHYSDDLYDGEGHEVSGYEATYSTTLYGAEDYSFAGEAKATRTDAGTTYMGLTSEAFVNTNPNFTNVTFEVTDGYEFIRPVEGVVVTITGHKDTAEYDGEAHSISGFDVSSNNALYMAENITFTGEAYATRTDAGTTYMGLEEAAFGNNNNNFKDVAFVVVDGSMTIAPKESIVVTITGHTDTKVYNGKAQQVEGYEVSINNSLYTANDFAFAGKALAARTDVGTTYMNLREEDFTNTNKNFEKVLFVVQDGYQTVTPLTGVIVTITGNTDSQIYDGKAHTVSGYTVSTDNALYSEDAISFSGEATSRRTNAGTTKMKLTAKQFSNTDENFANVTFLVKDGSMTITPLEGVVVNITGQKGIAEYDGTEHSVSGYTVSANSALYKSKDFFFNGEDRATRVDAGTSVMGLSAAQFGNTNNNFKDVVFVVSDGSITVAPKESIVVTITGHTDTGEYNGKAQQVEGYEVSINDSLYTTNDFAFTGEALAERTDAGTTYMGLREEDFTNTNTNFNKVLFVVQDGYQTITPLEGVTVTITGNADSRVYDGKVHTVSGFSVTVDNALYSEEAVLFSGEATARRMDAGTSDMGLTATQFRNTDKNFANVTFVVQDGYQTITPLEGVVVTITGREHTAEYDGSSHQAVGYDVEISNPLYTEADYSMEGAPVASGIHVGNYPIGLAAERFVNDNDNFKNVTFRVTDGMLHITKKAVVITVSNSQKIYGEADPEFTGTISGEVAENPLQEVTYFRSGKEEAVGSYAEVLEVTYTEPTDYDVTVVKGDFTITQANSLQLAVTDYEGVYDGASHKTEAVANVMEGTKITYSVDGGRTFGTEIPSITEVGRKTVTVRAENPNYATVTESFTLKVVPKKVTIFVQDVTKTYGDVDPNFEGQIEGLVSNDDLGIVTYGRTTAEEDAGIYAETIDASYTENANYSVTVKKGTFRINPIAEEVVVTIIGQSSNVVYDGKNHVISGYEVSISNGLYKEEDFKFENRHPGPHAVAAVISVGTESEFTEDMEAAEGRMAAVDAQVTEGRLAAVDAEAGMTQKGMNDEQVSVSLTCVGFAYMGLGEEDFENLNRNFAKVTFAVTDGCLVIQPKAVTIQVTDSTKQYGQENPEFTGTITGLIQEDDLGTVTYKRVHPAIEEAGIYLQEITASYQENSNYTITVNKGSFTIQKADNLFLTGTNQEYVYDGTSHGEAARSSVEKDTTLFYSIDDGKTWTTTVPTLTDVGVRKVLVKSRNQNYEESTCEYTLTVVAKEVTITVDDAAKVFGEKDPEFTGTVSGLVQDTDLGEIQYIRTDTTKEKVGVYEKLLTATYTENSNYKVTIIPGNFLITKSGELTIAVADLTVEYDGKPHSKNATVNLSDEVTVSYSVDGGTTWSDTEPSLTNAGSVTVLVKADHPDYETVTEQYTITITPKMLSYDVSDLKAEKTWDGNTDAILTGSLKVTGMIDNEDPGFTYEKVTGTYEKAEVGTHKVALTVVEGKLSNANYVLPTDPVMNGTIVAAEEEPSENPSEDTPDEPSENPSEDPDDDSSEESSEDSSEESSEESSEDSSEESSEDSSEDSSEESSEESSEVSSEESEENPAEDEEHLHRLIVTEDVNVVPEALKSEKDLNTAEKIKEALLQIATESGFEKDKTSFHVLEYQRSEDGGKTWNAINMGDKEDDITVLLPYPEGTNEKDFRFFITHMFTENAGGHKAGEVENLKYEKTAEGLKITVSGLAVISLSWKQNESEKNNNTTGTSAGNGANTANSNAAATAPMDAVLTENTAVSPKTGEDRKSDWMMLLLATSMLGMLGIFFKGKKKKQEE